jgi:beta-glucosidase-like glycosyl hydrolase
MVSSAIYPALSGPLPAVMAPAIYHRELPLAIKGAHDVTISDDLQAGAIAAQLAPARRAVNAGLDMAMYAQTQQASANAFATLLREAESGAVSMSRIQGADQTIMSLKRLLAP